MHLEDQVATSVAGIGPARNWCRPKKWSIASRRAVDGRADRDFVVMARTDAHAVEGQQAALDRAAKYVEAGADWCSPRRSRRSTNTGSSPASSACPVLANLTEFGKTPLFTTKELESVGVRLVLYPLSAFRAMSKAALDVFNAIRRDGAHRRTPSA